jgi:hypothetical protein
MVTRGSRGVLTEVTFRVVGQWILGRGGISGSVLCVITAPARRGVSSPPEEYPCGGPVSTVIYVPW